MGVLRRLGSRLSWALLRREAVGADALGNKYYRKIEKNLEGQDTERRFVKYAGDYDPSALPPEWLGWLQKTRAEAPDAAAMELGDTARRVTAERAAAADEDAEQARRRWQDQQQAGAAAVGAFTQQLGMPGPWPRDKDAG